MRLRADGSGPHSTTDALTGTTHYAFSAAGQVITITDALSHNTTMAYDLLDRQIRQADALGHTTVYTYNAAGDRVALLDANGHVTTYSYDLQGRPTAIDYPAGTADVSFTYNGAGERTQMADGLGTTTWTYDQMGRPITVTDPFSTAVGYVYDSSGNRLTLTYPDCRVAHYTYDLASRLTQVSSLCQDSASNSYAYDPAGRLITTTLANGITSAFGYDNADRLKTLTHSQFGWTLGAYTYTVDASGNRTGVVESLQAADSVPGTITTTVISYTYDNLYRLTAADYSSGEVFTYTYDAVGNRLGDGGPSGATYYAYDTANRLTTINGAISYTWDANGNLIDNGQGVTYTYDAVNRLVDVAGGTFTYNYDGLDNRLLQTAYGSPVTYTNDIAGGLAQVLVESSGTGATTYLYGLSRIEQQSPASTDYFLDDGLGSVRQLADASGDVTLGKAYDPYGHPLSTLGSGSTRFDFAGEYKDPSALIFLRARYYTTRRGRFIQADPWPGSYIKLAESGVSYAGSGPGQVNTSDWSLDYSRPQFLNGWTYAEGDPINHTDPSGHCPKPARDTGGVICVDLFIQTATFSGGSGFGDGRGFSSDSPPQKSRGYIYLYLDADGHLVSTEPHVDNPSCTVFGCFGPYAQYNHFSVSTGPLSSDISVGWHLTNGFSGALLNYADELQQLEQQMPVVPAGVGLDKLLCRLAASGLQPIIGTLTLSQNSGGRWYLKQLNRDPYPSLEIYYYEGGRLVNTITRRDEKPSGDPFIGLLPPELRPWLPNDTVP